MESWALQGSFPRVAFLCVSVADDPQEARQAALSFGSKLKLRGVTNAYCRSMPSRGQLGCSGFIVLRPGAGVVLSATPSYLQYGPGAHRWVEGWLTSTLPQLAGATTPPTTQPTPTTPTTSTTAASTCETCSMTNKAACAVRTGDSTGDGQSTQSAPQLPAGPVSKEPALKGRGGDYSVPAVCLPAPVGPAASPVAPASSVSAPTGSGHGSGTSGLAPAGSGGRGTSSPAVVPASSTGATAALAAGFCLPAPVVIPASNPATPASGSTGATAALATVPRLPAPVGHIDMDREHEACAVALQTLLDQPCRRALQGVFEALRSHFDHEQRLMEAVGFGGQGPMSGFQSHCNHHDWILDLIVRAKQQLFAAATGLQENTVVPCALPALEEIVTAFHQHADAYDALYAGIL